MTPQLVMLAGPNGSGKSTFYEAFLGKSPLPFLNADEFAAETGVASLEAARILDATRERMIADRIGFITETVFSDPHGVKLGLLRKAVDAGYEVTLIYIGITNAKLSAKRVAQRVSEGGHDVPRDRLESRFERSLANLAQAISFIPRVELFDNSSADEPFRRVAVFERGAPTWRMRGRLPAWARRVMPSASS